MASRCRDRVFEGSMLVFVQKVFMCVLEAWCFEVLVSVQNRQLDLVFVLNNCHKLILQLDFCCLSSPLLCLCFRLKGLQTINSLERGRKSQLEKQYMKYLLGANLT